MIRTEEHKDIRFLTESVFQASVLLSSKYLHTKNVFLLSFCCPASLISFLLHSLTSSDETKERLLRILYKKGKNGHVLTAGNGSAPCNINLMEKTEFEIAASMLRGKLVDIARFYLSDEDEAEDIVQEAMLKLWLVRDRLDREKNISPMGMTVTRNLCIDRLRRLKTHPHESLTGHDAPDGQRSAQAMMEDRENAEWMRDAVRNLPDKYRAVLRMRQVEHLEMGEIARIIGATEGVVRTILSRARKQMMEQLKVRRD